MWRFWRQFQLLCGRTPILSYYNDVCRLGPTHSDPHWSHSTGLLGRVNQWSSIYWRTQTGEQLGLDRQTVTPCILQPKLLKLCVKLGNSNRLLNAQGPKTNSESMCNGPEMFLAGLAHAASCDVCGLDSAQGPHALYTAHTDMPHDHNKYA